MPDTNGVLYQAFHFHSPPDPPLWTRLEAGAHALKDRGFTAVWIPPCYKGASGPTSTGYDSYDLFDLGEFETPWHNEIRTKYGNREELLRAIQSLQSAGLQVYADVVLNHKLGGHPEDGVSAIHVASDNRNHALGHWHERTVWTWFDFEKRGNRYSSMKWRHEHFDAVENDDMIFKIKGKTFEAHVDSENWNYDFLMGCDLDYDHPQVVGETQYWGRWFCDQTGVDGFRLDAVKHVRSFAFRDWLDHVRHHAAANLFSVGEYWSEDVERLHRYITETGGRTHLFDVPLHYRFHRASRDDLWGDFDLPTIFDGTLTQHQPTKSVTFVDNHDSQPLEMLESWVENWFKPMAYALILLRRDGYPCVFQGDLSSDTYSKEKNGTVYPIQLTDHSSIIDTLLEARRTYNYGDQHDYFDHPNCIGWFRTGDPQHPGCMAVVMSNGDDGWKDMETSRPNATFRDLTVNIPGSITTDGNGRGRFRCPARGMSAWAH